jgi:hypothetical protein
MQAESHLIAEDDLLREPRVLQKNAVEAIARLCEPPEQLPGFPRPPPRSKSGAAGRRGTLSTRARNWIDFLEATGDHPPSAAGSTSRAMSRRGVLSRRTDGASPTCGTVCRTRGGDDVNDRDYGVTVGPVAEVAHVGESPAGLQLDPVALQTS